MKRRSPTRTVLLVTNGRLTEKEYLQGFKKHVVGRYGGARLTVRVVEGEPRTVYEEFARNSIFKIYDETWVIIDHDNIDRSSLVSKFVKLGTKKHPVHVIVSVPCFEVWLTAHYEQVRNYQDQRDAQRHYAQIAHVPQDKEKHLPEDFPWDAVADAAWRCRLAGVPEPPIDTQGPCPSTTMPHLMRSLGLL